MAEDPEIRYFIQDGSNSQWHIFLDFITVATPDSNMFACVIINNIIIIVVIVNTLGMVVTDLHQSNTTLGNG